MAYVAGKAFCFPGPVTNKHCADSGSETTDTGRETTDSGRATADSGRATADSGTDTWTSAMRRFFRTWPAIHSAKIGTHHLIYSETRAPDNSERVVPKFET